MNRISKVPFPLESGTVTGFGDEDTDTVQLPHQGRPCFLQPGADLGVPPTRFLRIPGERTSAAPDFSVLSQALEEELFSGPFGSCTQSLSVIGMPDSVQEPELTWISSCCWEILQRGNRLRSTPLGRTQGLSSLTASAYGDGPSFGSDS